MQKYIETLDSLKIQNLMLNKNGDRVPLQQREKHSSGQMPIPIQQHQEQHKQRNSVAQTRVKQQPLRHPGPDPVVVTTKWETFDSSREPMPITFAFRPNSTTTNPNAMLNWEFFEWVILEFYLKNHTDLGGLGMDFSMLIWVLFHSFLYLVFESFSLLLSLAVSLVPVMWVILLIPF